eukprot:TRINITY_DN20061_c0_g1_i1.p1 TRINITY_DN20061_c0_g1~~TRINITY_DN20061_c0_g1_i1.p1  ORF type:complete len:473 (+),score=101.86 TRINITY_DN20061_c0_g1_i1:183-1601(+)
MSATQINRPIILGWGNRERSTDRRRKQRAARTRWGQARAVGVLVGEARRALATMLSGDADKGTGNTRDAQIAAWLRRKGAIGIDLRDWAPSRPSFYPFSAVERWASLARLVKRLPFRNRKLSTPQLGCSAGVRVEPIRCVDRDADRSFRAGRHVARGEAGPRRKLSRLTTITSPRMGPVSPTGRGRGRWWREDGTGPVRSHEEPLDGSARWSLVWIPAGEGPENGSRRRVARRKVDDRWEGGVARIADLTYRRLGTRADAGAVAASTNSIVDVPALSSSDSDSSCAGEQAAQSPSEATTGGGGVRLSGNGIGSEALPALLRALPSYASLRLLDLSHNLLTEVPSCCAARYLPFLQHFLLHGNNIGTLRDLINLTHLSRAVVEVTLLGNPVESPGGVDSANARSLRNEYRAVVLALLPNLRRLDHSPVVSSDREHLPAPRAAAVIRAAAASQLRGPGSDAVGAASPISVVTSV